MPKLTRDQAQKWDAQLKGGFRLDVRHYVLWGEKNAIRNIDLEGGKILRATLEYHERRKNYTTLPGGVPTLHLAIWTPSGTGGTYCSSGMGASIPVGDPQPKKLWSELCRLSGTITEEKIRSLAAEHLEQLKNPFVA